MSRLSGHVRSSDDDADLDLVPVMNMFLVLIPFLLMCSSFLHLNAVNASVPVQAEGSAASDTTTKVMVIVELGEEAIEVYAKAEAVDPELLKSFEARFEKSVDGSYPFEDMTILLDRIKAAYPLSDTVLLTPEKEILYDVVIQAMDAARQSESTPLFPNVVLSGKAG